MPPALSPVLVKKMRSPHSTGDEWPVPGNSAFQLMSASEILVGTLVAWLIPEPFGPRKRVHSWAVHWGTGIKKYTEARIAW